jgi:hypothetical protein
MLIEPVPANQGCKDQKRGVSAQSKATAVVVCNAADQQQDVQMSVLANKGLACIAAAIDTD